jgi:hypothetical protein
MFSKCRRDFFIRQVLCHDMYVAADANN